MFGQRGAFVVYTVDYVYLLVQIGEAVSDYIWQVLSRGPQIFAPTLERKMHVEG